MVNSPGVIGQLPKPFDRVNIALRVLAFPHGKSLESWIEKLAQFDDDPDYRSLK
jgi:hypothetical protein